MRNKSNNADIGNWKVLTVYFSHSGNTRECANEIHEQMGGDIVEIIPVDPYPLNYNAVVEQAKKELKSGYRPALKTSVASVESYDVIFVGSPNWWNTVAPPVMTFLAEHDLADKAIFPFMTHEGTGLGRSVMDIAALCPGATVLDGFAVRGTEASRAGNKVSDWLRKLGMQAAA